MVRYVCSRCGYVLYEFKRVGQSVLGVLTPTEIRAWFGDRCPRCGKPLRINPSIDDVVVR